MKRNDVGYRLRRAMRAPLCCFMSLAMAWSLFPAGALAEQSPTVVLGDGSSELSAGAKSDAADTNGVEEVPVNLGNLETKQEDADASKDAGEDGIANLGNKDGNLDEEETMLSVQQNANTHSEGLTNKILAKSDEVILGSQAQSNPYGQGWCTWYAWQRAADCAANVGGWMPTIWGNAGDWYANAPSAGLSVGATPKVNSIVVFGGGTYGHVGWVEGVHDGQIDIADMNGSAGFGNVSWHTISSALGPSLYGYRLLGYIYVPGTIEPGNPIPGPILNRPNVNVDPGDFVIRSAIGNKVLTIGGGSKGENGANAQLWTGNAFDNSVFRIEWSGEGHRIVLKSSGKVLDTYGYPWTATVANVRQWDDLNEPEQRWLFQDAGDGWVYIRNLNGYYLDVEGGWQSNRDGGNVQTWDANESEAQKWKLERQIPGDILPNANVDVTTGDYVICSAIGGRVLDIDGGSNGVNGANAQLWERGDNTNQAFHIEWDGGTGGYRVALKSSGKIIDTAGEPRDVTISNVWQWDDKGESDQRWLFQDAGDGWVYIRNLNGFYLDVEGGWSANRNGGNVHTWVTNSTEAQKWKLERVVRSLSEAAVSVTKSFVYTDSRLTPTPTVKFGGAALVKGTDYDVSYKNNVNVGTATVTVTGKGDYTGTKSATFKIAIPFADVTMKTGHAGDIGWLYEVKVSQGWALPSGDREYRPLISVARADMAAFLFRLATRWNLAKESWKPTGESSFSDVDASTAHYREIMWLAEQGISVGWNNADGTKSFRPYANVARADMAAFLARLYRLRGRATTGSKGFLDVDDGTAHSEDIRWLAARGVSKGWDVTGGSEFRPYANVARADMAAFLHRLDGLK